MALINQTKKCGVCLKIFSPKKGVTYRQWSKSFWCSRNCFSVSIIGRKLTKEHKEKIGLKNFGHSVSSNTRMKIALKNTGKVRTKKTLEKLRLVHLGIPSPLRGLKFPERSKEKHWAWKEDRTTVKIGDRSLNDPLQKQWRKSVKERDGWKCKIDNKDCSGRLEAHHILRWKTHLELRYEVNNGITLCHFHHPRKINDEMKLSPFFQELVGVKVN